MKRKAGRPKLIQTARATRSLGIGQRILDSVSDFRMRVSLNWLNTLKIRMQIV